ncbi:MAG TPA: DNA-directed RNA polymerase subunit omega, partial [Nitrospiria bacterium]
MAIIDLLAEFDDKKIDSRYRMVLIAAQRARQIMQGSKPVITSKFLKAPSIGLEEVLQGKVEFLTGKEARAAYKEAMIAKSLEARKAREAEKLQAEEQKQIPGNNSASTHDKGAEEGAPSSGTGE